MGTEYLNPYEVRELEYELFGGKGRERRQARRAGKKDEKQARKLERMDKRQAGKERRQAGRKEVFSGLFATVKDAAATIMGKAPVDEVSYDGKRRDFSVDFTDPEAAAKARNQQLMIIGVVFLVIVVVVLVVIKKGKSKK